MNITVSEKTAEQVQKLISDGVYPDADAAIQDAIRILADLRDRERLIASIRSAEQSIDDGRGSIESDVFWNDLPQRADERRQRGLPINPDVLPRDR